jgi:phosphatidylinositol alpha-1,6-mannosyltransferase
MARGGDGRRGGVSHDRAEPLEPRKPADRDGAIMTAKNGRPTATRFLVLTPAIDGADGISELSRQVVGSLARSVGAGHVDVWALDGGPPHGVPASSFWTAGGSRFRIVRRAMARAARSCDDLDVIVLHAHLAPLAHVMGRRGARVAAFLIGVEVWTPLRARERRAIGHANRLIAISEFTARGFREANPALAARPVTVCAPGIGAAPAIPRATADGGFALIVGRLSSDERYKGHDALIDVWPAVRAAVPAAQLVVVGDGDDRGRLEALVASRGLSDAISFTGRVDDRALTALYARSAFFVMPSAREGFGLVYLEAMRVGKPCIGVHGSADEIIRHGIDGLVVDCDSPIQLVAALVQLYSDGDARKRMGASACARVRDVFAEDVFDRRLLDALGAPALATTTTP